MFLLVLGASPVVLEAVIFPFFCNAGEDIRRKTLVNTTTSGP